MPSLQKLKKEVQLNTELTELLDVLKGIASSEFRTLEKRKERFSKFTEAFGNFFHLIDFSAVEHPFAKGKGGLGIIMVTSDEGFMGGLNTRVINTALGLPGANEAELVIIGERGAEYLKELGRRFTSFAGIGSSERYEAALRLKDYIMKEGLAGKFGRLVLVYPKSISFTVQTVETIKILPCSELFEKQDSVVTEKEHVIIESSLSNIIEYLLGTWITQKLFEVFEDSKLAEFSARTVHLEESHQILSQKGKELRFQYFRSRHGVVDKSMRETFLAQLMRKRK